jgi:hypothetical protein
MNKFAAIAVGSALLGCALLAPAHAESCKFTAQRTANVASDGVKKVVVTARAGDLVVRGDQGRNTIQAGGRACASSQELLAGIRIESRRDGDTVHVEAIMPEQPDIAIGFVRQAYLDLTVLVPRSVTLVVEDSSGDLRVSDVQGATVKDSSGDQDLRDIAGAVEVADSSGDVNVSDVGGTLRVKDSSGDVDVRNVTGDVVVTADSSGDLDIRSVAGSVHVIEDDSGDIEVAEVQRDVTIDEDSSGSIRVQQVGGNFTVNSDSSGSIQHDRVLGSVRLPRDHDGN